MFLVCYISRIWEFKKIQKFTFSWVFCPFFAHNSNVQSFPEIKYSFTGRHDAEKVNDRRDQFQYYQTWIFPYTFSECHIKKKPKITLWEAEYFFANQIIRFSLIESCRFWFVTSQGFGDSKRAKNVRFHEYFVPLMHTIVMFNLSLKLNTLLPVFWIMHHTGIEPMSTAWKAAMLPLHQRCWKGLRSKRWISEISNMDFSLHIF